MFNLLKKLQKDFLQPQQQIFSFAPEYEQGYRGSIARIKSRAKNYCANISTKAVATGALGLGLLLGYSAPRTASITLSPRIEYATAPMTLNQHVRLVVDIPIEKHLWDVGLNGYERAATQFAITYPTAHLSGVYVEYESRSGKPIRYALQKEATDRQVAQAVWHIQEANREGRLINGKKLEYQIEGAKKVRDGRYEEGEFIGRGGVRNVKVDEHDDSLVDAVAKGYPVRVIAQGEQEVRISSLEEKISSPQDPINYAQQFNYGIIGLGTGLAIAGLLYLNRDVSSTTNRKTFMSIDDICEATGVSAYQLHKTNGSRKALQQVYRAQRREKAKRLCEQGLSYRRIAQELGVSYSTARRDVIK